ncbi:MAG: putative cardiolipin synthase [Planctomycetota bacterium]|jgi:putative cardiolipin synthase
MLALAPQYPSHLLSTLTRVRAPFASAFLLVALGLGGCVATIGSEPLEREPSWVLPPAHDSDLGRLLHPGDPAGSSRFAPVDRGPEGLDLRLALASTAEVSLDVQSYLWHEDGAGSLLLERLLKAADRGVRVRLLIDGFKLEGNEDLDEGLDLHPNLEIRVFNPTLHRSGTWRKLELLENLGRLDHRMHNKLLLADGVAGVFGGRNVGDEYFGLGEVADFRDFDLFAAGPVVAELGASFDEFWNGEWTVPLRVLIGQPGQGRQDEAHAVARAGLRALHNDLAHLDERRSLEPEAWLAALGRASAAMLPGRARVVHDSEHLARQGATGVLGQAFEAALGAADGHVLIVTAYLVPDENFLEEVRTHIAMGHRVQILTNSRATNNQPLAHSYYARSRDDLLDAGAELYELRHDAFSHVLHRSPGSDASGLGLHAKSAVFGTDHVLVGSMNVDPRSMQLNTELGVLIESPQLAARVRALLARELEPRNAWRVTRGPTGALRWEAGAVVLEDEPGEGSDRSFKEWLLELLPLRGEV